MYVSGFSSFSSFSSISSSWGFGYKPLNFQPIFRPFVPTFRPYQQGLHGFNNSIFSNFRNGAVQRGGNGWGNFNNLRSGNGADWQKGGNGLGVRNAMISGRNHDTQIGGHGNNVLNNMYSGRGNDYQVGGTGFGVRNNLSGGLGHDAQVGGNGLGTRNIFAGGAGNDSQIGGAAGTHNIFKPGSGTNTITTKAGTTNFVDLSTFGNNSGRNIVNGAAGITTVDARNYQGPGSTLNLNDNDNIRFNPYTGLSKNITVNGNPKYTPIFNA